VTKNVSAMPKNTSTAEAVPKACRSCVQACDLCRPPYNELGEPDFFASPLGKPPRAKVSLRPLPCMSCSDELIRLT